MIATTDEAGRIVVGSSAIGYRPTTAYVPRTIAAGKDGTPAERTVFEPITSFQLMRHEPTLVFAPSDIRVFTIDGKPVETAKLLATLRAKPTPVVVASELEEVREIYGDILKPGTIVILLPAPKPAPAVAPPAGGR